LVVLQNEGVVGWIKLDPEAMAILTCQSVSDWRSSENPTAIPPTSTPIPVIEGTTWYIPTPSDSVDEIRWIVALRETTIYAQNSADNEALETLEVGDTRALVGQDETGDWLVILWDEDTVAWVARADVTVYQRFVEAEVVPLEITPTAVPPTVSPSSSPFPTATPSVTSTVILSPTLTPSPSPSPVPSLTPSVTPTKTQ
jgi:hypothetical protein